MEKTLEMKKTVGGNTVTGKAQVANHQNSRTAGQEPVGLLHLRPGRSSAIYEGTVYHQRRLVKGSSPAENAFKYPVFMVYVDLNECGGKFGDRNGFQHQIFARHWLWSVEKWNVASLHREDYFGNPSIPLATCVRDLVEARTGTRPSGSIRMLCNIRYFGYNFNPVVIYYCFEGEGENETLHDVVLEVSNTPWLEKRLYVLPFDESGLGPVNRGVSSSLRKRWKKDFHVSPFMNRQHEYFWKIRAPGPHLNITATSFLSRDSSDDENNTHKTGAAPTKLLPHQDKEDGEGDEARRDVDVVTFQVVLKLEHRELSFTNMTWCLLRYPLMTGVAQLYIHWQAVKVLWKGVKYVSPPKESPQLRPATLVFHLALFLCAFIAMVFGQIVSFISRILRCSN